MQNKYFELFDLVSISRKPYINYFSANVFGLNLFQNEYIKPEQSPGSGTRI